MGYTHKQRAKLYQFIWHPSPMANLLLVSAKSLMRFSLNPKPIRGWTTKIRHEGIYTICTKCTSKTTKYRVMKLCPIVVEAWNNFKDLKTRCSLQRRHNSWGEVFIGEIKLPRHDLIEEHIPWDLDKPFIITLKTLWDILR